MFAILITVSLWRPGKLEGRRGSDMSVPHTVMGQATEPDWNDCGSAISEDLIDLEIAASVAFVDLKNSASQSLSHD